MKEAVTKVIDTLTQEDFHEAFEKLFERYNKCIVARGDYFEGDLSFMCVLSIKVPIRKSLETYLMILVIGLIFFSKYLNIYFFMALLYTLREYVCRYLPSLLHGQDVTQGQFLSGVQQVLIPSFSSSWLVA